MKPAGSIVPIDRVDTTKMHSQVLTQRQPSISALQDAHWAVSCLEVPAYVTFVTLHNGNITSGC